MAQSREQKIKTKEAQLKDRNSVNPNRCKIGEEVRMRIVACAGDPGLSEPWYFDVLSRFLICMREPTSHVPTNDKARKMFFLVKRPRHLWIDGSGSPDISKESHHSGTRRKDYLGNVNIGHPSGYSINTIPELNIEYNVGDIITARRTPPEYATDSNSFVSAFPNTDFDNYYLSAQKPKDNFGRGDAANHGGEEVLTAIGGNDLFDVMHWSNDHWTDHGGSSYNDTGQRGGAYWYQLKPLMAGRKRYGAPVKPSRYPDLQRLYPPSYGNFNKSLANSTGNIRGGVADRMIGSPGSYTFWFILHYYMVDLAMAQFNPSYSKTIDLLGQNKHRYQTDGFGETARYGQKQLMKGKNLFKLQSDEIETFSFGGQKNAGVIKHVKGDSRYLSENQIFSFCEWEDTNTEENRQRTNRDDCMPLVIASPNNFPIPKERKIGSIIYEPAYATVVAAQQNSS